MAHLANYTSYPSFSKLLSFPARILLSVEKLKLKILRGDNSGDEAQYRLKSNNILLTADKDHFGPRDCSGDVFYVNFLQQLSMSSNIKHLNLSFESDTRCCLLLD